MSSANDTRGRIAVLALAGKFPGAEDLDRFWENLAAGRESIVRLTREELLAEGVPPELVDDPRYVPATGVLEGHDRFDAAFFGMSPREAEVLDPQHRLFLETCWEALESAGYNPLRTRGLVGVYGGAGAGAYMRNNLLTRPELKDGMASLTLGNQPDFLSTAVSYRLNLRGPSLNVQSACSTALVAVSLACQALVDYQTDMALAGGVSVAVPHRSGYLYVEGGIGSPDGHLRAFDAAAAGSVRGNGVGVAVLKRLEDALADGDPIRAVIRGWALNNDGSGKVGFTAPGIRGQAQVIAMAQGMAGVRPDEIGLIEGHGSGTPLGDPIEFSALSKVFAKAKGRGFCALGSVKTNVGHCDAAAGMVGLSKVILALEHGQIPPSLHFERPNPQIPLEGSAFYVPTDLREWPRNGGPRRAGINSFGIGGTNVHVVLEEAPPRPAVSKTARSRQLLVLSAKTPEALDRAAARLAASLRGRSDLADVAYTLQVGREPFACRRAVVCRDSEEAAAILEGTGSRAALSGRAEGAPPEVAFLFPGLGDQYPGMARGLYRDEPAFRAEVDRCCEILLPHLGKDLRDVLYPGWREGLPADDEAGSKGLSLRALLGRGGDDGAGPLADTVVAQPALFVVEYALAKLWMSWGLRPAALIGYSLGEYVAACLAGVFSLEDALRLMALRAKLLSAVPAGAMLAVPLSEDKVARRFLGGRAGLSLSAVNGPSMCVVGGEPEAVAALEAELAAEEIPCRRLETTHAFHSHMMEPVLGPLRQLLAGFKLEAPKIPFYTNVTGRLATPEVATPEHWVSHLRQPVRFGEGLAGLMADAGKVLLEVGPGQALTSLALQHPSSSTRATIQSLRHRSFRQPDVEFLLNALAQLWLAGAEPDWQAFHSDHAGNTRRRVSLPAYPFDRRRYWIEPFRGTVADVPAKASSFARRSDVAEWLWVPVWKRVPPAPRAAVPAGRWLLLTDGSSGLAERLRAAGADIVEVRSGERFRRLDAGVFSVRPAEAADWSELLAHAGAPERIVHLWGAEAPEETFDRAQELGFYSLVALGQALGAHGEERRVEIAVVTRGLWEVSGGETLTPEQATVLGPCRVIPQEYPHLRFRVVDLGPAGDAREMETLLAELAAPAGVAVAHRGGLRWVETFEEARTPSPAPGADLLREGGVYLITGGLGNIGLAMAESLARNGARLVLTGRTGLPDRRFWDAALESAPEGDPVAARIRAVRRIEELGGEVLVVAADASDEQAMRRCVALAEERFGGIHGVFHLAGTVGGEGFRPLSEVDRAHAELHFRSKARALYVLERVLASRELDFWVLFSSSSSVLGGLGFTAYAAANAFLDFFALSRSRGSAAPWLSLDWDSWRFGQGEAVKAVSLAELWMTPEEGFEAVRRALSLQGAVQVVMSPGDLDARLERWVRSEPEPEESTVTEAARGRHERPDLPTPFVAPRNAAEEKVAALWSEMLGIGEVGIHDNFFQLGGHSLVGIQVVSRLRRAFGIDLPVRLLFEAPTVAEAAEAISRLGEGSAEPALEPRGTLEAPLSFAQLRLWLVQQMHAGSNAYNFPVVLRLRGPLDAAALAHGLSELARRHEVLRSRFRSGAEEPVQVPDPPSPVSLPVTDLSHLPEEQREAEAVLSAERSAVQPFDLEREHPWRAGLIRLGTDDHVLSLTFHHAAFDGWSLGVFLEELGSIYGGSPLPDPALQYGDFAAWQRRWLRGEVLERQLAFWRGALAGAPPFLELPADHPRPALQSFLGAKLAHRVSADAAEPLLAFCRREGITSFHALFAAFLVLLRHATGRHDLVVGTDLANRNRLETERLLGFFVNLLPVRVDLSGGPTFREAMERVRDAMQGVFAHQEVPFEKLVEALRPERTVDRNPLVQVLFVLQNAQGDSFRLPGLDVRPMEMDPRTAKFDLLLSVAETAEGLVTVWNYCADLFEEATVSRLAARFERVLRAAAADPGLRIDALDLRTEAERRQMEMDEMQRRDFKSAGLRNTRRRAMNLAEVSLVEMGELLPGETLPLVVSAASSEVDLYEWASHNRELLDTKLLQHGGILFRGFPMTAVGDFERLATSICPDLFPEYGDLPKEEGGKKIYKSTPYPNDKTILFHNESSHMPRWPMKQWFFCVTAAQQGGETPVVDCRKLYRALDPAVAEQFESRQLMYVRNFIEGLDVSWQDFFRTEDRAEVERKCAEMGMECEWRGENHLRTRQLCPAVVTHPRTGEKTFFNQVQLHHVSCLDPEVRESLTALYAEEDLPRNVYFGDGAPIPDAVMEEVGRAYWATAVQFPWREGDVLMLDNMLVAHARNPFVGPRKIAVAMGEMFRKVDLRAA